MVGIPGRAGWDGSPEAASIVAVADSYDTMTSARTRSEATVTAAARAGSWWRRGRAKFDPIVRILRPRSPVCSGRSAQSRCSCTFLPRAASARRSGPDSLGGADGDRQRPRRRDGRRTPRRSQRRGWPRPHWHARAGRRSRLKPSAPSMPARATDVAVPTAGGSARGITSQRTWVERHRYERIRHRIGWHDVGNRLGPGHKHRRRVGYRSRHDHWHRSGRGSGRRRNLEAARVETVRARAGPPPPAPRFIAALRAALSQLGHRRQAHRRPHAPPR